MVILGSVLGWLISLMLGVMALSMFLTRNTWQGIVLLLAILFLFPPVHALFHYLTGKSISPIARIALSALLIVTFGWLMNREKATSIYFSTAVKDRMMEIYDSKLAKWPTPYESRFIETTYGRVHVIVGGPDDAPPVILLNAGQMSGWSWIANVGKLNEKYRTYAIDTIGEPGKSELRDIGIFPKDGKEWSDFLVEITDKLEIGKAYVVGASYGGLLALNYAIYQPERIERMVLLGAMGLPPSTNENVIRIATAQLFPLQWLLDDTVRWSMGDDPQLRSEVDDWFYLVFQTTPKEAPPTTMKAEDLKKIHVPTLSVLGKNDRLMGNLDSVRQLASNVPGITIVEIESGHLMGLEKPEICNPLILDFFERTAVDQ